MNEKRILLAVLFLAACAPAAGTGRVTPARHVIAPELASAMVTAGLNPELVPELDSIITAAIADKASPGVTVAIGRNGHLAYLRGYGSLDWASGSTAATDSSIFDMASLTKVVATTTALMMLEESGQLDIDRTLSSYLPEINAPEKTGITIRQLLTHRGGFEAFAALWKTLRSREQFLDSINKRPLANPPGTKTVYSDWDFILLGLVVERISGTTLDSFTAEHVFKPVAMNDTRFLPPAEWLPRIAYTEVDSARGHIHGSVHDPNAWAMGGVAGHAGLFSSARDLSVFTQMMLNGGEYNGVRLLKPTTIARWTARQGKESSRALGWDTPSPNSSAGHYFSPRSFGHTGYTGTSIWVDPKKQLYVVLLTSRVNPTSANQKQAPLRRTVADAVQRAVIGAPLVDWESKQ
jgi:CubicO group peptidase (beta-lactamase class C family)